jgi:hypothetical protein
LPQTAARPVDINGDGSMEWEEFTGFLIDAGMNDGASRVDRIEEYVRSPVVDTSRHDRTIERVEYLPRLDQVCGRGSADEIRALL